MKSIARIYFSNSTLLVKILQNPESWMLDNIMDYDSAQPGDKWFLPKLSHEFDTRTYRWLESCALSADTDLANNHIFDFSTISTASLANILCQYIMSAIKFVSNNKIKYLDEKIDANKNKKKRGVEGNEKVENKKMVKVYTIYNGKNNAEVFAGKFYLKYLSSKTIRYVNNFIPKGCIS